MQDESTTSDQPRVYRTVAIALFILLGATIVASKLRLGPFSTVVALAIAAAKAILVAMFFMHLARGSRLARLFAAAGLFWLAILLSLTLADVLARMDAGQWLGVAGIATG